MEQYRFDPYTVQPLNPPRPVNNRTWLGSGYQSGGTVQAPVQPQPPEEQANVIVTRVASNDEAKAVPTDFSGKLRLMLDWGHGYIYAKALGDDGNPVFRKFRYEPEDPSAAVPVGAPAPAVVYAPLEALEQLRQEVNALREELAVAKAPAKETAGKPAGKGSKT